MNTLHVPRAGQAAALLFGLFALGAQASVPVVEETLSPAQISIGESAELKIKTAGTDTASVQLPVVPGLEFRVVEQLRGVEFVRGVTLATTTLVVRVTPQIAGTFAIPEVAPKSPPLILRVDPANLNSTPSSPGGSSAHGAANLRMTEDDAAFVKLTAARGQVYVGELVPITIELGARAGAVATMDGPPALSGRDFTLTNISQQPDRRETVIDGKPFLLLSWHSVLAPVKPGDFPLSIEVPLTIRVSTRPKREAQFEDQLGDPFMQRVFGTMISKKVKAQSAPLDLSVSPLPTEGRPPEFSGAVGSFKISSELSSASAAAGDPLTLRMRVTGSGNFDRVDSPMLEHLDHWKTYPPTSTFKAADALGFEGERIFEQPLIALLPGAQVLPGLEFAYFDPASRRYVVLETAPLRVEISPSAAERSPKGAQATPASAGIAARLRPDRSASSAVVSSLLPPYLQPRFFLLPLTLALALAGARFGLRRRMDAAQARRRPPSLRGKFAQMERAARARDGRRFLLLAREILEETFAQRWRMAPGDITPDEVGARLEPGPERDDICRLLGLAHEVDYAGRAPELAEYARWLRVVDTALAKGSS